MRRNISEHIKSDAVDKTINPEKQARHDRSSNEYIPGRSYLLPGVDPQQLVNEYHGTGRAEVTELGAWKNVENVIVEGNIGVKVDHITGKETVTNRFTIHYSNTGTHVVPAKPLRR